MAGSRQTDPGLLELVGKVVDLLGLAEHVQRFLPTQRLKVQRRHHRVEKLLDSFNEALGDARTALRVLGATIQLPLADPNEVAGTQQKVDDTKENLPRIGFSMPREELPVYRRGVEQLQAAIQKMTKIAFDLEATSTGVPDEMQRYYKISQAGNNVLRMVRGVLDDHPESVPEPVSKVDSYLARCSQMLEARERWLDE